MSSQKNKFDRLLEAMANGKPPSANAVVGVRKLERQKVKKAAHKKKKEP